MKFPFQIDDIYTEGSESMAGVMSAKLEKFVSHANSRLGRPIKLVALGTLDRVGSTTSFPKRRQK
jgi:hypothetical protein